MRYRCHDGGRGLTHGLNAGGQSLDPGDRGCALPRFPPRPFGSPTGDAKRVNVEHGGGENFEGRRFKAIPTERHAETPLSSGALRSQ